MTCIRPGCTEERAKLAAAVLALTMALEERTAPRLDVAPPTYRQVMLWVQEREQNCLRMAESRTGEDRAGWIEDARFHAQIPHFLGLYGSRMIDNLIEGGKE